ncbi:hypothetical protein [Lederbergia lenta]|uniref:hypothetical protein n=1 Tax=Lederbergia lenta TaxID=1467 RepID=UPI00203D7DA8|nr:hypothetical protein [Lederbergia lenta]MCM3113650.1 hypothetical protein [Lederbergia lenta]
MNQEQVKDALLELLDSNGKRGRKWFFPKNVDNQYKILANMTLKELVFYILPALILSAGIGFIPPRNSIAFWAVKSIVIVFIIVIPIIYVNYRPVKLRDNIRSKDFLKEYFDYRKKKKMYFVKPKSKLID